MRAQIWDVLMRPAAASLLQALPLRPLPLPYLCVPTPCLTSASLAQSPTCRLQLSQACMWGWVVSSGMELLFPRAALDELEHGVCFFKFCSGQILGNQLSQAVEF